MIVLRLLNTLSFPPSPPSPQYLTPEKPEEGFLTAGVWYALVFEKMFKERQEMPSDERKNVLKKGQVFMMLNVLDLLVDEVGAPLWSCTGCW